MNDSNKMELLIRKFSQSQIGRREFMSQAIGLGVSAALASALVAKTAASATPKRGGHLIIGLDDASATDSLDPALYNATYTQVLGMQFYNTLAELDVHNEVQPSLATGWEVKAGSAAAVWVIKIRKGVTFHNGKELTAADVVYSINHHRDKDSKSGAKVFVSQISNIVASDKYEVTITLASGNADLPYILADYHLCIMPEDSPYDKAIGAGAYILDTFKPGERAITRRNPNFWNSERGFVDSVETVGINDPTARIAALQSGSVNLINRVGPQVFDFLKSNQNIQTYNITGGGHYIFAMLCDVAPFNNNDVRLAVKYSIKRQQLIDTVLRGYGGVGNDQPIPKFDPMYAADIPQHPYDPDKARFHMKRSGFTGSLPLSVSDVAMVGAADAGVLIQNSAAAAGIKVDVIREPADGYWDNVWMKKPWCITFVGGRPTANLMFSLAYKSDAAWNDCHFKRPDFDKILVAARSELDYAKRKQMYHDLQEIVVDDGGAMIPMFYGTLEASSKHVKGFVQLPTLEMSGFRAAEKVWLEA